MTLAEVLHEGLQRIHRRNLRGGFAEGEAMGVYAGRQDREQIAVGGGSHLGREMGADALQPGFVVGQGIRHRGAQDMGAVGNR